jgi:hypothetical protein
LALGDEDALVGIVEVRRDDVAGWESDQEIHASSGFVGVNRDAFGSGRVVLFVGPIGRGRVDHDGFGTGLRGCERNCAEDRQNVRQFHAALLVRT